jgi:DNA repair exonuclease SbcCD nuclease subunit
MKILVIGDPHFKVTNVAETEVMCKKIIEYITKSTPDLIVILGDVLDTNERIHMTPLIHASNFMKACQDLAPLYVIIGNHDRRHNKVFLTPDHPFVALHGWHNTTICDVVKFITINDLNLLFVPYVEPGRFNDALNTCEHWQSAHIIFCHQEFKGAHMGPVISEHGDDWDAENPYVISGHIHEHQLVGTNIFYPGTPMQHHYDTNYEKWIWLFDIHPNIREHADLKYEKWSLNLPIKKEINLKIMDINGYKLEKNVMLKINIEGTPSEIKTLLKHPKINEWKKKGVKIIYKYTAAEKILSPIKSSNNYADMLYDTIKDHDDLFLLYMNMFGG